MWVERALLHVCRALRRQDGFALITTVVISSVMMLFTMGMLATGLHLTNATVRDTRWNTALQVAEAGLDHAVYSIGVDDTYAGTGTGVVVVPGGEVEVFVDRPADGQVVVYATGWVPTRVAANALSRRIRVAFAPEDVFKYALFSETGLFVKNNGVIVGDVFANEGVEIENGATVVGNVISATEGVTLGPNAVVREADDRGGDVYSGGPAGITTANNVEVDGSMFAQATSCAGSTPSDTYDISAGGGLVLGGTAIAWGDISGVAGTPHNCQLAPAANVLPTYTWDASLYTGEVEYTTIESFLTYIEANPNTLAGVHRVWVPTCSSDPTGASSEIDWGGQKTIVDSFTLITNCRLNFKNNIIVTAPDEDLVDIVVMNGSADPAAVEIKNSFTVENDPAVLLYTPGLISVKNNPDHNGAVYAGAISVKNNLDVTYDPRVERTLGFGDVKYDRMSWQECVVGTTGTGC